MHTAIGLTTRDALEAREQRELAPFASKAVESQGRVHAESEHP